MLYINERRYYLRSINAVVGEWADPGNLKFPARKSVRVRITSTVFNGGVAQWLELATHNRQVAGSIPATPTPSIRVGSDGGYRYSLSTQGHILPGLIISRNKRMFCAVTADTITVFAFL